MPALIDFKVTNPNGAGTSLTFDMPDGQNGEAYASGDDLIAVVYKEAEAGGDLALTVATGWTEETPAGEGKSHSVGGRYGVWRKTAASASETAPVITTSNSDEMVGVIFVIRGADATTLLDIVETDFQSTGGSGWPGSSVTNNDSLALLIWGSSVVDEIEVEHESLNDWLYVFRQDNNNAMNMGAYMAHVDSGAPSFPNREGTAQVLTLVVNDDDGSYVQPFLGDANVTPISSFKENWNIDDSVDAAATAEDPTTDIATINGESTNYVSATTQDGGNWIKQRGDQFVFGADTNDAVNIIRQNYNGTTVDFSGDAVFSVHCGDDNDDFSLNGSLAGDGDGIIIILEDSTGDWSAYNCVRREFGKRGSYNQSVFQFQPSSATALETSGTIDLTDVTKISFAYHKGTSTNNSPRFSNAVRVDGAIVVGGGGSSRPLGAKELYNDILDRMAGIEGYLQGEAQLLNNRIVQLGDTSVDVYADFQYDSLEFVPNTEGLTQISNGRLGLHMKPNANSTVKGNNCTLNGIGQYDFKVLSGTSASATLDWKNCQILNAYDVEVRAPILLGGSFISNINSFESNGHDLSTNGGVTIDNCSATYVETITSQADLDKFANCTFTNNNTVFNIDVAGDLSLTADNITFTGNTYDVNYTGTGTVTWTNSNGSNASTETSATGTVNFVDPGTGIEFTGLEDGSQVKVYETGTTTKKHTTASSSGGTVDWDTTGDQGTVDYEIHNPGYIPIRVTGVAVNTSKLSVGIVQQLDPIYSASSGLTHSTHTSYATGTDLFSLSAASTVRNFYSAWIEFWKDESAYENEPFPLQAYGYGTIALLDGAEFAADSHIESYLTAGGVKYLDSSDVLTAEWCGIQSVGEMTGITAEIQQTDGGTPTDAAASGTIDQTIKIYGDATHGNFDYRGYMVVKAQPDGYRPAVLDVVSQYGTLEGRNYIFALEPEAISGASTGDPGVTGLSITNHGASPVTWNSKDFSVTITDTGSNTAEAIRRWINYNLSLDATFQGDDPFNFPEMVVADGDKIKTERGDFIATAGATLKGIRAVDGSSNALTVFSTMMADDGTLYTVPVTATGSYTGMPTDGADILLQITNETGRAASAWTASDSIAAGDYRVRSTGVGTENNGTGFFYVADSSGTTGGSEPAFPTTAGNTVTDNGITWTCRAVQFYSSDPASANYSSNYTDGEEIASGDSVRIRFAELNGGTSFKTDEQTVIATSSGFTAAYNGSADSVYAANGTDGSSITKFSADFANDEIDLAANSDFSSDEAYAFYCSTLTTADGIEQFWGGVEAPDSANYKILTGTLNLYFDNTTTASKKQTDNARIYRDDAAYPVKEPTTSGYGIDINWKNPVYLEATGSALTTAQNTQLMALQLPTAGVDGSIDVSEWQKIVLAALAGKSTDMESNAPKFRNQADDADVISATTDANGNRTAVTLNP